MFAVYNGLHAPIRHYLLGLLAVRLGDLDDAEREAAALDTTSGPGDARAFGTGMAWAIRGHVLAERGRLKDALAAYQRAELRVSEGLLDGPFGDQGIERFARAEVLRALGRLDEKRGWYASLGTTSLDLVVYAAPAAERLAAMERGTRERR
jgi:hypothetical protein